ncbi:hypothetical protein RB595_005089 [Gaeumannomyces hyphopodioides]
MDETQTRPELSRAEQVPANPPSRKRQLDSNDDAEPRTKRARTTQPTPEPARLTRQNLAEFNKMGKKKTSNTSDDSGSTKTISTTSTGFAIQTRKNGILEPRHSKPPTNLENLHERHARSRETASPPESVYKQYTKRAGQARNETTMVIETSGRLLKEYDDEGYTREFNQAFTGYPKNVGFNNGLSTPQPDFVEGLEMEEYLPFPVDEYVAGAVLYKDDPGSVTLPHIAGEWKGPAGDMREAELQSRYDGAALVHARNQALSHMGKSDPPGHAEITTFTTDGKNINFFAHYAAESEDGTLEYHQFPIKSTSLVNSHGEHKEGRRGLRNAQDHAREQSYALKDQLKEHYKQQRSSGLHPIAEGVPTLPVPGTEPLHAYEDEDDYKVVELQPVYQPTPHSSKAPSSTHDSAASSGQKRKASSSQTSSQTSSHASSRHRHKSYWKKDPESGRYYHKHSDGTVSWLSDDDGE